MDRVRIEEVVSGLNLSHETVSEPVLCSFRKVFLLFHVLEMIVDQQQTHLPFDIHMFLLLLQS